MHKIIQKKPLGQDIYLLEFEAADIALAAGAGQFVMLRIDENGERFPLTLYDFDKTRGTVSVVCQAVGKSTRKLCSLNAGDAVRDMAGPLGHAVETRLIGKIIIIGGGVGTAEAFPIARAMQRSGNDVTVIIGARSRNLVISEQEMRAFCSKVIVVTDDGSCGRKGLVTDVLRELMDSERYDLVYAIGPAIMMKKVSEMTLPRAVKTMVSLNSIMIDGTGMCGGCRIIYGGKSRFVCVDGPEFDGHKVDFDDMMRRGAQYRRQEKQSLESYEHQCRISGQQETK
jgi:ferredoxin--NADP+ reductase